MFAAVAVATAAFTVLTGAADSSKLIANHEVTKTGPSAYDILVRPAGSQTPIERESGEVRPGFLDGVFGGITLAQYASIKKIPGVEVAAPVAMVGYTFQSVTFKVALTSVLGAAVRQLFEASVTTTTDRGLSKIPAPPSYIYVTRRPLVVPQTYNPTTEVEPGGTKATVCALSPKSPRYPNPYVAAARDTDNCFSIANRTATGTGSGGAPSYNFTIPIPVLIEAIDPVEEARLDGLSHTIVSGRYLRASDAPGTIHFGFGLSAPSFPVIVSSRNYLDDALTLTIRRLDSAAANEVRRRPLSLSDNASRGSGPVVTTRTVSMNRAYRQFVRSFQTKAGPKVFAPIDGLLRVRPVRYTTARTNGALQPVPVVNSDRVWRSKFQHDGYVPISADNEDRAFRQVTENEAINGSTQSFPVPNAVGVFDPNKLPPFDPLTHVPLGGYEPTQASPADPQASAALQGRSLLPNANLGGFLGQPPQFVTTLSALPTLENSRAYTGDLDAAKPITAIRVRVAGVHGVDPLSRARLNLVAQDIINQTGLQVDITTGSSPSTRVTDLPAGSFGRPALALREGWIDKGVALRIIRAVDRKSLLLFILVLVVCGLFVLNAATAAVRARRVQLGVLACVGWSPRQLFGNVMSEQAVIGLTAGIIGLGIATPIATATHLHVTTDRGVIAVLAAVALSTLTALPPAISASRAHPLEAIRPVVATFRSARPVHGVVGLSIRNLIRGRTRSAIAAVGLAVGICSAVLLLAITTSFNGQLAGDLLGQAVTLQVRGVDYAAVIVMVVLGVLGIADVLYLNIRERGSELATLQATGWSKRQVAQLITVEGAALGFIGSLIGTAAGLALITGFTSETARTAIPLAAGALIAGTILGATAAVVPSQTLPARLATALAND